MNLLFKDSNNNNDNNSNAITITPDCYLHLALDEIIDSIAVTKEEKELMRITLSTIPRDDTTCIYRQSILKDFLYDEALCNDLFEIIKKLDILKEYHDNGRFSIVKKASLYDLIDYMNEMEVYIEIIDGLNEIFNKYDIKSLGLLSIRDLLKDVTDSDRIDELKEIVSSLRADISTLKSVTLGVNLSPDLRPEEIKIIEFNNVPYLSQFTKTAWGLSIGSGRRIRYQNPSQFMKYICDDMEKELSKNVVRYKKELKEYINFKGYFLLDILNDLRVYLMMARFGRKLTNKGYTISFPEIDNASRDVSIKGIYNLRLAIKNESSIVKNDFTFSNDEKIFILTGPNRGGKTMLTQALGINALFASLGFFVMADSYIGYTFKNILTHFPQDENLTLDLGRLGEEATRTKKIVKEADPRTLVLLNETYSSTSATDALYLAFDLVHILKHNGVPTVFNTHLHELARNTKKMNEWDGDSNVVSLTMEIKDNVNTYKVLRQEPDNTSFARNIALKYGVTYEQFLEDKD